MLAQISVDTLDYNSIYVQADQLLHHEVEGQVDGLVEEVEELENQRAELVDELVNKMVKEVDEVITLTIKGIVGIETTTSSMTTSRSSFVTPKNTRIERCIYGLASQIHRMVEATEPTTIQSAILKAGVLTDEAIRNGSLKKDTKKRGNDRELSRDRNVKDDNKRSSNGRVFATTTNPVRKDYTGSASNCTNCNFHHNLETPCPMCTNYNRLGHFSEDFRAGTRTVNPLNTRNLTAARRACLECSGTDRYKGG
nr:hypothetical protein [Tanacetum cinerariifolium]